MSRDFNELLRANWQQGKFLCAGLDPEYEKIPGAARKTGIHDTVVSFDRAIVDATKDIVCAYKPNTAFYEAHGEEGISALREICSYILDQAPNTLLILDAKRADIGNTNRGYAQFAFEYLHADAITLHPYLGGEALEPFLSRADKGSFILCRTSNQGSGEIQDLEIAGEALYMHVAKKVAGDWNKEGNCGIVAGATYPDELANIRGAAPEVPILIPGIGAQGGDPAVAARAASNKNGGFIASASRALLYASPGADFARAARFAAAELDKTIRAAI